MRTVFADTFYYLALLNERDQAHGQAIDFNRSFGGRLVTTAWVLTELADGLRLPGSRASFCSTLELLEGDPDVSIVGFAEVWWREGIALYRQRPDKEWSLTDCISFAVMRRQGITEALTGPVPGLSFGPHT
jgi:predicted nucleic acid-binding protein